MFMLVADNYGLINDIRAWLEAVQGILAATHDQVLMNCVVVLTVVPVAVIQY